MARRSRGQIEFNTWLPSGRLKGMEMGKASRMKKERKGMGASSAHGISESEWTSRVCSAVINDDVEALNVLSKDRRFSILDIQVAMADGEVGAIEHQNLIQVASRVGAVKCMERLCFIAASADNLGVLTECMNSLYARYESEHGDKRKQEGMILAALEGAEKGLEGPAPGIFLILSLNFPNATRFAMSSMADRRCGAVKALPYKRAHNENKRKLFGAMANGDVEAIDVHLRRTQSNLQKEANLIIGTDEVKRIIQVAAACGRSESVVATVNTMRGLQGNLDQKGAVIGLLMSGVEELGSTVNMVRMPWLDQAVEDCVAQAVIEDRELGDTILNEAGKVFSYVIEAAKKGALSAFAELERRELASQSEMYEVIERVSSALRV